MYLLHNIGERRNSNYNTIEEILALPNDVPISFDGLYANVHEHAMRLKGRDITIFVCGNHTGGDNSFDANCGMPNFKLEKFCDWNQIVDFCEITGAKLGWHSWTHRNLTELSDEELVKELTPPFPMKWFAYPYGNVDDRVAKMVMEMGYLDAWSVTQGNGELFQRKRRYLNW